ncbi:hypothetical protein C1H46_023921 [Malus baccata]|uniref:Uncharacterized protein n=1 Tax=Malus baccata TaxID=106549 RepID=A0A540LVF3_MALBA|nr:hypothetical protein C1H46_023921 [Malus baccata]
MLSSVTRKLSSAKITGSLSKRRFQPSVSLSLVSTCHTPTQLCGNYGQLCQKARNLYYSSIHRLPTISERTVPVVKKNPISLYLRLPQQRHTLSALLSQHFFIFEMAFQQTLSSHFVFLIPWDTPANNPFKAKVFHIIKVESKSISYHAFSFLLLVLIAYLALLSSTHLQHFVLPFVSSSAWGASKGSEDDTSKYVETIC